jgi:short-subunit dehydrogenase
LVVGASGGIGAAMVETLRQQRPDAQIESLHRHSEPKIDFADENSIARAAQVLKQDAPFHLIINAAGVLHTSDFMPEKKLDDLHYAQLRATFEANTFSSLVVALLDAFAGSSAWCDGDVVGKGWQY